ncbi:hypothetical protein [Pseudomonas oryzihabitans]|uniref:hypothetical protein n=1 Tax=Pseudomonas oryzihabitans TaxID=47885 RepID=UPI001DDD1FC5|nr:hypothetical protein [Pseudomonas oryzihabitans]HJE67589.1 hypothetical protein [Pseudomonas oryzihabitans]
MAELASSRVLNLDGQEIIVRELTVAGVRQMLMAEIGEDVVNLQLFSDVRLEDLVQMTSLTADQIDAMRPSQLEQVIKACKEMNPDFFGMLVRLEALRAKR